METLNKMLSTQRAVYTTSHASRALCRDRGRENASTSAKRVAGEAGWNGETVRCTGGAPVVGNCFRLERLRFSRTGNFGLCFASDGNEVESEKRDARRAAV